MKTCPCERGTFPSSNLLLATRERKCADTILPKMLQIVRSAVVKCNCMKILTHTNIAPHGQWSIVFVHANRQPVLGAGRGEKNCSTFHDGAQEFAVTKLTWLRSSSLFGPLLEGVLFNSQSINTRENYLHMFACKKRAGTGTMPATFRKSRFWADMNPGF